MTDAQALPARRRKLPARFNVIVMPLAISVLMTCIVSGISTFSGIGPAPDFLAVWMQAWATSWVFGFPVLIVVLPMVRRLVATIVEQPGG